jgi:hypothetical protein
MSATAQNGNTVDARRSCFCREGDVGGRTNGNAGELKAKFCIQFLCACEQGLRRCGRRPRRKQPRQRRLYLNIGDQSLASELRQTSLYPIEFLRCEGSNVRFMTEWSGMTLVALPPWIIVTLTDVCFAESAREPS